MRLSAAWPKKANTQNHPDRMAGMSRVVSHPSVISSWSTKRRRRRRMKGIQSCEESGISRVVCRNGNRDDLGRSMVWAALWWEVGSRRYRTLGKCSEISQGRARFILDELMRPLNQSAQEWQE